MTAYQPQLRARLEEAQQASHAPLSREEIADVVQKVINSMTGDLSAANIQIFEEINHLAKTIESARSDIAALRPLELKDKDLPTATDELDAVVGATEEATNTILSTCEDMLNNLAPQLTPAQQTELTNYVTKIFEACNFQDITGQRINKVVKTLKIIEERIERLLASFGPEMVTLRQNDNRLENTGDAALLNGPQLPAQAIDQDDIDALLASLGN